MAVTRKAAIFLLAIEACFTMTKCIQVDILPEGTCQYGEYFFPSGMRVDRKCARLTCDANRRQVNYEECEIRDNSNIESQPTERSSGRSDTDFPYCCQPEKQGNTTFYRYLSKTYHRGHVVGLTVTEKRLYVNVEREILTCKRPGKTNLSKRRNHQQEEVCCQMENDPAKKTAIETRCPTVLDFQESGCVLVSTGQRDAAYPACCSEYLCLPAQRYCSTGASKEELGICEYKLCDGDADVPNVQRTYTEKQLRKHMGCRNVLQNGNLTEAQNGDVLSSKVCPEMICPNVTEHVITASAGSRPAHMVEIGPLDNPHTKYCVYNQINVWDTYQSQNPCQEWTCDSKRSRVNIKKCSDSNLGGHCKWSGGDKQKHFPDCCPRRRCEEGFTRYTPYV
uniref:Single domain-containing protein n=1 Tax=Amblyomma maculatum TaxID=34609 RepID=G3MTT7_AMBMU